MVRMRVRILRMRVELVGSVIQGTRSGIVRLRAHHSLMSRTSWCPLGESE